MNYIESIMEDKRVKPRAFKVQRVKIGKKYFQRAALFFVSLVLMFGIVEPGLQVALAESKNAKTFKTDFKLDPLQSAKVSPTTVLSEQAGGSLAQDIDNPKGHKSEDTSKRTAFTSTFVNNDGTRTLEYSAQQQNYQDGKTWKKIDNAITPIEQAAPDASFWQTITNTKPEAPAPVQFKGAAGTTSALMNKLSDGLKVTVAGKTITMKPVGAKDVTPVQADDHSVIYKDAWPNTDLEYELRGETVKEIIVIKNKNAPTSFKFTVSGGKVIDHPTKPGELTVEGLPSYFSFSSLTLDLNDRGVISENRVTQTIADKGAAVAVTMDSAWMKSQPASSFPMRIDPSIGKDTTSYWMFRSDGYSCGASNCYANIGAINDGGWKNWRSYVQFPFSELAGKKVLGANLHGYFQGGKNGDTVGRTIWMGHANCVGYNCKGTQVGASGGQATDFDIDFTAGLQQSVTNSDWGSVWSLWGEEGAYKTYKPYYDIAAFINYDTPTPQATAISPADQQVMIDTQPTLKVNTVSDADGDAVQYYFRVSTNPNAETGAVINSGWINSPQWSVPDGILQDGTTYYWHAYTKGATQTNPTWVRSFKVDLRTGKDSTQSYDTVGPVGIDLATGNASLSGGTHSMKALAGNMGLSLNYNTPNTAKKGLTGEYWNVASGYNFANGAPTSTPNLTRRDQNIDFSWSTGSPANNINSDYFYTRWTGQFVAPTTGTYQFGGSNDDNMHVWVNNTDLYNQGCYSGICYDSTKSVQLTAGQAVPIRVEYMDATSVAYAKLYVKGAVSEQVVPQSWLYTNLTNQSSSYGLTGRYYTDNSNAHDIDAASSDPSRLMMVRQDTKMNLNLGTGGPAQGLQADNFMARWTGYVTVPTSGTYTFGASSDDGIRVKVNTGSWQTALDYFTDLGSTVWGSSAQGVSLQAGRQYPIQVDWFEHGGAANIDLMVKGNGYDAQEIPPTWLTPDANALPSQWKLGVDVDGDVGYERLRVSNNSVILEDSTGSTHEYTYTNGAYKPPVNEDGTLSKNSDNGYTFIDTDGRTYIFDATGKLTSLTSPSDDRQPAALKYTYAGDPSRLTKIEDGTTSARYATVYYKGINDTDNICDKNGTNNPSGFLGLGSSFADAPSGKLCAFKTSDGDVTNFYYDNNGDLARIVQPGGQITDYAYDSLGRITAIRDSTTADAIAAGIRDADSSTITTLSYDSLGRITSVVAPTATAGAAQLTHTISYAPGQTDMHVSGASEPNGYSKRILYDSLLRTTSETDLTGKTTQTEWDPVKDLQLSTTDATGLKSTTIYDQLDRATDTYGAAPSAWYGADRKPTAAYVSQVPHTSTGYDEGITGLAVNVFNNSKLLGTPKHYTTGFNQTNEPSYSLALNNTSIPPTDGLSMRATGKIKLDQAGNYNFRLYEAGGARLFIDNQLLIDSWTEGAERFSTEATYPNTTAGKYVTVTIEAHTTGTATSTSRIAAILQSKVAGTSTYVGTNLNQKLTPAYSLTTSTTAYDNQLGNVTSTTQYSDPAYGTVSSTTLDPGGLNYVSQATYEAPGAGFLRQTSKTLPGGAITTYQQYGQSDSVTINGTTYSDKGGYAIDPCSTSPTYGQAIPQGGQPKGKVDPTGRITQTIYNMSGDVIATRYNTDPWTCTSYDARGRVTTTTIPYANDKDGRTITNNYAVSGNPLVTSTSDDSGTITVENDLLGRTVKYTDALGKVTTSIYDDYGKLTSRTSPIGTENYEYDSYDRLTKQKLDGVTYATVTYDQYSRIQNVAYAAAISLSSITRDDLGRENGNTYKLGTGQTLTDSVTRYVSGDIQNGTELGTSKSYTYDKAGRLTGATIGANTYSYGFGAQDSSCAATPGYDAGKDGNRTSMTINGHTTTYCYNSGDQLVSSSDPTLTNARYDSHGNTTSLGDSTHQTSFTYDSSDRNTGIASGNTTTTFARDVQNRITSRTQKVSGDTKSLVKYGFTGSGDTPDYLLDSANNVTQKYLTLPGDVLVTIKTQSQSAGATTYSLPNIHGDIFATVNADGALMSTFLTGAFGEVLPSQPAQLEGATAPSTTPTNTADGTTYGYVGQHEKMTDTDSSPILGGVTQMGARVYISALGRFLSIDSKEGGTDNNYAYENDPVNSFDLDGNAGFWSGIRKSVQKAARWAWKNRDGIAAVASIGLMFVPGVGAAVGVARVGITAYKIARVAKAGGTLVKFGTVSARTSNLAGRIYTGRYFGSIGKSLVSRNGLRQYRVPMYKPRVGQIQSNFVKRGSTSYKWGNANRPGYYNGHLRVRR